MTHRGIAVTVPSTVFMFSGQGSHYYQMGRQLFDQHARFREWLLRLDQLASRLTGESVLAAVYSGGKVDVFDRTLLTHPAIFMIEYSLAQCLIEGGVAPDLLVGASLGSFAAAAIAGHLAVEQAMTAVVQQAAAFEACCEPGGMIAAFADPALYEEEVALRGCSELAGVNFATHFSLSAPEAALPLIEAVLRKRNVTYQRLAVSFAFHSRWIDDARPPFQSFMQSVRGPLSGSRYLPLVCCEQAALLSTLPQDFFWRVVRQPIRLPETIARLERSGPHRYIDVGPAGTMATFVKYGLPAGSRSTTHSILTPYGEDLKNFNLLLT